MEKTIFFILKRIFVKYENLLQTSANEHIAELNEIEKRIPENDMLARSYKQYLAQKSRNSRILFLCLNLVSFILIIFEILFLLLRTTRKMKEEKEIVCFQSMDKFNKNPAIIEREKCVILEDSSSGSLGFDDLIFITHIFRKFPYSFYFLAKSIWKIAIYSHAIKSFTPKKIVVSAEHSFTSSLLTLYCEEKNVEHICSMHGEILIDRIRSFFQFHKMYVWDIHYKNILIKLKAEAHQFSIKKPKALENRGRAMSFGVLKYYSQLWKDEEHLLSVIENLKLKAKNLNVKTIYIRLHPREFQKWSIDIINANNILVEDFSVNINQSIDETEFVCSGWSTVLYEAYLQNRKIIIDNSMPGVYEKLVDLEYIMTSKEHDLLVS